MLYRIDNLHTYVEGDKTPSLLLRTPYAWQSPLCLHNQVEIHKVSFPQALDGRATPCLVPLGSYHQSCLLIFLISDGDEAQEEQVAHWVVG